MTIYLYSFSWPCSGLRGAPSMSAATSPTTSWTWSCMQLPAGAKPLARRQRWPDHSVETVYPSDLSRVLSSMSLAAWTCTSSPPPAAQEAGSRWANRHRTIFSWFRTDWLHLLIWSWHYKKRSKFRTVQWIWSLPCWTSIPPFFFWPIHPLYPLRSIPIPWIWWISQLWPLSNRLTAIPGRLQGPSLPQGASSRGLSCKVLKPETSIKEGKTWHVDKVSQNSRFYQVTQV